MSSKKKSPRRQGRERAFQVLYGCGFSELPDEEQVRRTFDNFIRGSVGGTRNQAANGFAWELVSGVMENKQELDRHIAEFSKNWRLERIAKIELAILRLSLYEMLYRIDVPVKVAINEGIELSKKFGDSKSSKFVNGILDAVATRIKEGRLEFKNPDKRDFTPGD